MKIAFKITRPLRNAAGLRDFSQSAKGWIATLFTSLADQLADGGDGSLGMEVDGVCFDFRITKIPGVLETHKARILLEDPNPSDAP